MCTKCELDTVGGICFFVSRCLLGLPSLGKLFALAVFLLSTPSLSSSLTGKEAGFPEKGALFWEDSVASCQCVI